MLALSCVVAAALASVDTAPDAGATADASHGWGPMSWTAWPSALEQSRAEGKPIMLVIHKSWCGACKALRPQFAKSEAIAALADGFVMVNTVDDEEPKGEMFAPDGGYIPRVLFLSEGEVLKDVINVKGNEKYKYYYSSPDDIAASMASVKARLAAGTGAAAEAAGAGEM